MLFMLAPAGILLIAQTPANSGGQGALTVAQVVETAKEHYPAIKAAQAQQQAAQGAIGLAKTAYLPHAEVLWQTNRATANNIYGLLLPQSVIPNISGPVIASDNTRSAWSSGVGSLVNWQPFDFGLRAANVATATAARNQAQAAMNRTRYDVAVATADAFLTVIAAQKTAEAARAGVDSWQVLLRSIHALTAAELRPGADESRVQAELAAAQTQIAQAEQAIDVARSTVAQFVGLDPAQVNVSPGKLTDQLPAERPEPPLETAANPVAMEQVAAIAQTESQRNATGRTYYPQFLVQGLAAARGSGLLSDGSRLGALNGLAPTTPNFGIGLTVTFPAMDRFALREQESMQSANIRAGQAESLVIAANLQAQFNIALATLAGARRVAANTPIEVASARAALQQATARYQSGLAPIDDVAQAQRLLVQAQIDDSLARLSVWRAKLRLATARGDVQPFLAEVSQ